MRKVALIGYGAIAQKTCQMLSHDTEIAISQVIVRPENRTAIQNALPEGAEAICGVSDLDDDIDFVLECAGHEAVRQFAPDVLASGVDFGVISSGALADQVLCARLERASHSGRARLIVLPGAIGGVDALAATGSGLDQVTYVSRKPPLSWRGAPAEGTHDLANMAVPTAIFTGNARDAALQFPKNANVVATVALAGIGFDATQVTLMADPQAEGNTHHIKATGPLFDLNYVTKGAALPDNPKTSALTALSAVRMLRHRGVGLMV